jgi:excisionase family DNA binding protein
MQHGQQHQSNGAGRVRHAPPSVQSPMSATTIPFTHRLTCTIAEACEATGLGRTKLYELIGAGSLDTTTIGRRRLVLVRSLQKLLMGEDPSPRKPDDLEKATAHDRGQPP